MKPHDLISLIFEAKYDEIPSSRCDVTAVAGTGGLINLMWQKCEDVTINVRAKKQPISY